MHDHDECLVLINGVMSQLNLIEVLLGSCSEHMGKTAPSALAGNI